MPYIVRAFYEIAKEGLFWLCLLAIIVAALLPRFVVIVLHQYFSPSDIQISKEAEKFGNGREFGAVEIEMNPILDPSRR